MSKKKCFVVSQIGNQNSDARKHADSVLNHIIKPALQDQFDVVRVDEIYHADKIDDKIFQELENSDLVIADLTGNNPNVFLEIGYRMALDKNTIYMIQKNDDKLPFDIQSINIIHYDIETQTLNILDEADKAKDTLKKTVDNMKFSDNPTEKTKTTTNEDLKTILINIGANLDKLNQQISDIVPQEPMDMNERLIMLAMNEPDKLENLLNLMNKFPDILNKQ